MKTRDMMDLVKRLEAGAHLTVEQVARDYGVNRRTAQRWFSEAADYVDLDYVVAPFSRKKRIWYVPHA